MELPSTTPAPRNQINGRFLPSHNKVHSMEYRAWMHMKQRCCNPRHKQYPEYGGRGINVCDRWRNFDAFYEDMGDRPSPKHSLDRRNNDLGYSKDNCRWATRTEQNRNHRGNRVLQFNGKIQCIADWADEMSLPASTIQNRLSRNWSIEDTLTTPRRENYPLTGKTPCRR